MSTPTPSLAPGALGTPINSATALIGGAALSPTSTTSSDFDHLSTSCTSLQSYVHVDHFDVVEGAAKSGSVVSPVGSGSGSGSDSVISEEDDEIVWPMSPQGDMSSPVSVSGHEHGSIAFASCLTMNMNAMSLMSSSIHSLARLNAGSRSGLAHTRSRSVPILGEDVVLVGSRAASATPLAAAARDTSRLGGAVPPLENSQFSKNLIWSEEVEHERAIAEEPETSVNTPTVSVFAESVASAIHTPTTRATRTTEEDGDGLKVMGAAWKRRNRRRKAAAAMAAAAAAEGVGVDGDASEFKATLPHPADVIVPYAPTPVKGPAVARPIVNENIDGGIPHECGNDCNPSKSVSTNGSARSYPLSTTPTTGAQQSRPVTPPIRPRAPEPAHVASTTAAKKGKNGRKKEKKKKEKKDAVSAKSKPKKKAKTKKTGATAAKPMTREPPADAVARKANETNLEGVASGGSAVALAGLGQRPVVDDVSENGDEREKERLLSTAYEEAVKFMNQFILNPSYYTSRASRLTFLQALILELGLCHEFSLPNSLSAARALLRSHAFLNVRDYLAVRSQGMEALREAMYPSRNALVKDLRGSKRSVKGVEGTRGVRAELGWVKETGLTVLLVSCYQH